MVQYRSEAASITSLRADGSLCPYDRSSRIALFPFAGSTTRSAFLLLLLRKPLTGFGSSCRSMHQHVSIRFVGGFTMLKGCVLISPVRVVVAGVPSGHFLAFLSRFRGSSYPPFPTVTISTFPTLPYCCLGSPFTIPVFGLVSPP